MAYGQCCICEFTSRIDSQRLQYHAKPDELGPNNNKFYKIQLIKGPSGEFSLLPRWGRVGEDGRTQEQGTYKNAKEGLNDFAQKFKSKTGNTWAKWKKDKDKFVSMTGKSDVVEMEEDEEAANAMSAKAAGPVDPCQLDPVTQALVDLILTMTCSSRR